MTWVMSSTSMPRAAMSVATSTRALPRLKLSSARWRAFCDLLPWMASARCRVLRQLLGDAVGAVLGAGEDDARGSIAGSRSRSAQQRALVGASSRSRRAGRSCRRRRPWPCGATSTRSGLRSMSRASLAMSSGMVAENSSVWRSRGSIALTMLAHVADEAHVEHAVGLVEDEDLDRRPADLPLLAPGRAGGPAWRPGCRRRAASACDLACPGPRRRTTARVAGRGSGHRCEALARSAPRARASASG